jgi:CheY-like chemotaxis protein
MDKKRILVVDDEEGFTRMLKLNLEKLGIYEVLEVNDARQALDQARRFKPDLILLDVIMPEADGGDVAAQFQADPAMRSTPILFLTAAVSRQEAGAGAVVSGGMMFISKPVTLRRLVECIEQHLKR